MLRHCFSFIFLICLNKGILENMRAAISLIFGLFAVSNASVNFVITNRDGGPIWVGIQGNSDKATLENGGFSLAQYDSKTVVAPDDWAGRFWSRTWCDTSTQHCLTGDCGNKLECQGAGGTPPATLVEITLKGYGGVDYYDISLVDGWNSLATITPVNGEGDGGEYSCKTVACSFYMNTVCPSELQLTNDAGTVIGCKSACLAFGTDEYCCAGDHSTPETCQSSSWAVDYPAIFKSHCPDAYSYAYDDHKSTFTCKASTYNIVFGGE